MSQERKFSDDFAVIGDVANGTSILFDRHTGLEVAPSEPGEDLVQQLKSERHAWIFAIAVAEFTHWCSPRRGTAHCIHAAKRWLCEFDPERRDLEACKARFGNVAFTAGWLGVKVGDPSAGTLMACFALTKPNPFDVVQRVVRNSHIMHFLRDHRGRECRRLEQSQLVARLLNDDWEDFLDRLFGRWEEESYSWSLSEER